MSTVRTPRTTSVVTAVLFVPIAVVACATAAWAAPVQYAESVGGDLAGGNNPGDPLTTFTLDVGAKTVSGTFGQFTGSTDFDSFGFIVPAGMSVTGGSVVLTDGQGDIVSARWSLRSGSANAHTGPVVQTIDSPSPGSAPIPALGPDSYNMSHNFIGGGNPPTPRTSDYTFTLTVVPEPASLAVLALVTLAFLPRRN